MGRLAFYGTAIVLLATVGCRDTSEPSATDGDRRATATSSPLIAGETSAPSAFATGSAAANSGRPPQPLGPPNVTGRVSFSARHEGIPILVDPSDGYYVGMRLLSEDTVLRDADGRLIAGDDLAEGNEVAVWIGGGGCAESDPVACDVLTIEVTDEVPARSATTS